MKKHGALGKGLEALLGGVHFFEGTAAIDSKSTTHLFEINVELLIPGVYQPRTIMDKTELSALAESIKMQGVLQPILVRKKSDDQYEIIAGERRWRAAQIAGLKTVPVIEKSVSHEKALAIALIENIQREDLSALEEANAMERLANEFNLTHQQVAEVLGKSRSAVTNAMRLLTLPDSVKQLLAADRLTVGHAKVLMSLETSLQLEVANTVVNQGLSVRETEALVSKMLGVISQKVAQKPKTQLDPDVLRLQENLSEKLGAKLQMIPGKSGSGRLVIHYNSLDELEGILAHIQ
jgi:ParB family chromosome partitioning protein